MLSSTPTVLTVTADLLLATAITAPDSGLFPTSAPDETSPSHSLYEPLSWGPRLSYIFPPNVVTADAYNRIYGDFLHNDPDLLHCIYFQNIDEIHNKVAEIDLSVSSMAQLRVGTFCWANPGLNFLHMPAW